VECSAQFVDIECINVAPGSIILDMTGPSDKLTAAKFNIMSEGLWLPSFQELTLGHSTVDDADSKSNDSFDLFDTWHIYLFGIGLPSVGLCAFLIMNFGRDKPKPPTKEAILLEEDHSHMWKSEDTNSVVSPSYHDNWKQQDDYVDLDVWGPSPMAPNPPL